MAEVGTREAYAKLEPSYLRRYFPTVYTAAVTVFLINFALGVPTSALADVLKYKVGAPSLLLFWAQLAVLGMGKAIADLVGGYFADKWKNGRRNVMITGTVLVVIGSFLIYLSFANLDQSAVDAIGKAVKAKKQAIPALDLLPLLMIVGGQFLNGFGIGMQNGAAMILLQDYGGATKRGLGASLQKFSLYGGKTTATYLGALLGAVTGKVMFPFLFVGILAVLAMVLNIVMIKDSKEHVLIPAGVERKEPTLADYKPAFTNRSLYSVYFVAFMGKWSDSWFQSVSLLFLFTILTYSKPEAGAIAAAFGVLWSVLNAYSGWFSDFVGRRRIALVGTAMGIVTPLLFLWFLKGPKNVALGIALAALWGLGTGLYYGITEVVPGDVARLASRGAIIGTFRFFRDTGNVLVPLIFAVITDPRAVGFSTNFWGGNERGRYELTLWATSIMMVVTFAVVWSVMRETFEVRPITDPVAKPAAGTRSA